MIVPEKHVNEKARLAELKSYNILDTLPDEDYDGLTKIAAQICNVPVALISLVDDERQWFKSTYGLDAAETPRNISFCGHAINDINNTLIVEDAREDERFFDNPIVTGDPNVIFYAGVPLKSDNGLPLGTLCVIDSKPGALSDSQNESLTALAKQVINLLTLRKKNIKLNNLVDKLEEKNLDLEQFAYAASHDIKSPISNISNLAGMFMAEYKDKIDEGGVQIMELILRSTEQSYKFLERLMEYTSKVDKLKNVKELITIKDFKETIYSYYTTDDALELKFSTELEQLKLNNIIVDQILINLINNAEKYNDKAVVKVNIDITETDTHYRFSVSDNGPGIEEAYLEKIFKIFIKLSKTDKYGKEGSGLGLSIVSKLVNRLGGNIIATSVVGQGSTFTFTILK